jgi:hypothetical protein
MALDISIGSLDEFEEDGVNVQCSNAVKMMVDLLLTMELTHNGRYFSKQIIGLSVCTKTRDRCFCKNQSSLPNTRRKIDFQK